MACGDRTHPYPVFFTEGVWAGMTTSVRSDTGVCENQYCNYTAVVKQRWVRYRYVQFHPWGKKCRRKTAKTENKREGGYNRKCVGAIVTTTGGS